VNSNQNNSVRHYYSDEFDDESDMMILQSTMTTMKRIIVEVFL